MIRLALIVFLLLLPRPAPAQDAGAVAAASSITEGDVLEGVEVIAHDSMAGRDTPSPGLDMTAGWVAEQFRRLGLEPGGDEGTFLQHYVIQHVVPDYRRSAVTVSGDVTLSFPEDLMVAFGTPQGREISGGVAVFAGGTPPDEIPGEIVRGRHLVVVPPEVATEEGGRRQMRLLRGLMDVRPASILMVSREDDREWDRALEARTARPSTRTPWQEEGGGYPPILAIREASLTRVLQAHDFSLPPLPDDPGAPGTFREVPGLDLTLRPESRVVDEFRAPNAVGILSGSHPRLRNEYLVYSAHMDHVGTGRPDEAGDSIYNGADDNASGTVAMVELAEAFAMLDPAPRRSVIFLAVSGEERGLWGSEYFAANPPVPLEGIVANLNADMIARNWSDSIVVIGQEHSSLGETLHRVAANHPELDMAPMRDIWPEERFFFRSDHVNFARRGVPALFFFNGPHDDYHRPTDEVGRIDAEKAARIVRLMFFLGLEVANDAERPEWNPESYAEIVTASGG